MIGDVAEGGDGTLSITEVVERPTQHDCQVEIIGYSS